MHNIAPSKKPRLALRGHSEVESHQEEQIVPYVDATPESYALAMDAENDALNELDIAKNALITLKASHAKERADLISRHTSELLQAESTLLRLRQQFLEAQKSKGLIRRQLDENNRVIKIRAKEERRASVNRESDVKFDRQNHIEKIKVRISDLEKNHQIIDDLSRRTLTLSLDDPDLRDLLKFQQPGEKIHGLLHRLARGIKREIINAKNELITAKAGPWAPSDPRLLDKIFTPEPKDDEPGDGQSSAKRLMPPPKSAMDALVERLVARKPAAVIGHSGVRVDVPVTPKKKL